MLKNQTQLTMPADHSVHGGLAVGRGFEKLEASNELWVWTQQHHDSFQSVKSQVARAPPSPNIYSKCSLNKVNVWGSRGDCNDTGCVLTVSVPVDQEVPGVKSAWCHECYVQRHGLWPWCLSYNCTDSLCVFIPVYSNKRKSLVWYFSNTLEGHHVTIKVCEYNQTIPWCTSSMIYYITN